MITYKIIPESGHMIINNIVMNIVLDHESFKVCSFGILIFPIAWSLQYMRRGGSNAIAGAQAKLIPTEPHIGWE